ncbi:MAG TPA: imidazole glycerol phosphate synthase subunit HisH [Caulobacteraceae bacterium]|nr:imidazole glycerol phosphate synthase subunit HisH [Caulobacteraceae bacterium]
MPTLALIDYGSGNLRSAEKALVEAARRSHRDWTVAVTFDPETVAGADRVVLPGVGAFAACRALLHARDGLVEAMSEAVQTRGAPFLGVCVGMQLLATRGLEFGETPGLDWIPGEVRKITPTDHALKVPHMGWNALAPGRDHAIVDGAASGHMYFTHSYALHAADPSDVIAWTDHGGPIVAAVARGNVAGVQFHPEKSQARGLRLLGDFLEWRP